MMPQRHGCGWYPPQTTSYIQIRHMKSVWAIGMLSQGHMIASLYRYTGQVAPRLGVSGSLEEWKWCHNIMVEADIHLRPLHTSILAYAKCLSCWYAVSNAYGCTLIPLHWPSCPQIWEFRFTWGVEMMPQHHGWGWYPPQTASCIHIRHMQSVWAIGMRLQGHMVRSTQGGNWRIRTRAVRVEGGALRCSDSPVAAVAEAKEDADISTIQQIKVQYCHQIGELLLAARQFSPLGAANSQFWIRSRTHKLCPRATTSPKPWGCGIIIANFIIQGSIFIKKLLDKISKGGGCWFSLQFSVVLPSSPLSTYRLFGVPW
jgi:hypothetical protein